MAQSHEDRERSRRECGSCGHPDHRLVTARAVRVVYGYARAPLLPPGDWREGWLQNYHKHMMARIEIKRAEDRVSDLSIRFPVSDGTQNEDDESEFEVDGIGNVVD